MNAKELLSLIGWKNQCPIYIKRDISASQWGGMVGDNILPILIKINKKAAMLHSLLHECFHVMIETRKPYFSLSILREYRVEKQVRDFCKKYGLIQILNESDKWVERFSGRFDMVENEFWRPYCYAAWRFR